MFLQKYLLSFSLLCATLVISPITSATAQVFNPESFTLDNGLQVIVIENHRAPVINQMIAYRVGAKDEPMGKSGIAHFMEHLMFKGTEKVPTGEFSQTVRSVGGRDNAYTTQDYTAYFQSVAREYLPLVMEMEADRMTNLTLTDKIVAVERDVILKERGQRTDNDPVGAFWEDVNNLLFVNHPYSIPVIGWRHEIETLSKNDIEAFYKKWYAPNNAILILSGDISLQEAKNLTREYYASIARKELPDRLEVAMPLLTGSRRLVKQGKDIQQALWSRHYVAPSARTDNIKKTDALIFLQDVLGSGSTGQLYKALVIDQKIATNAFISYSPQFIGPTRFSIIVTPNSGVSTTQIETAVEDVIKAFFATPVTQEKINETAQTLKIKAVYARDTLSGPARILGGALGANLDIKTVENWPKRVDAVTPSDVMTSAEKLLIDNTVLPVTAIMLPEGDVQ